MHNLSVFGLGIFFALAGIGLFAMMLRKAQPPTAPIKKSEQRAQAAQQTETTKLRIAGVISAAVGAALMILS